jgi:hypothetical protein
VSRLIFDVKGQVYLTTSFIFLGSAPIVLVLSLGIKEERADVCKIHFGTNGDLLFGL